MNGWWKRGLLRFQSSFVLPRKLKFSSCCDGVYKMSQGHEGALTLGQLDAVSVCGIIPGLELFWVNRGLKNAGSRNSFSQRLNFCLLPLSSYAWAGREGKCME